MHTYSILFYPFIHQSPHQSHPSITSINLVPHELHVSHFIPSLLNHSLLTTAQGCTGTNNPLQDPDHFQDPPRRRPRLRSPTTTTTTNRRPLWRTTTGRDGNRVPHQLCHAHPITDAHGIGTRYSDTRARGHDDAVRQGDGCADGGGDAGGDGTADDKRQVWRVQLLGGRRESPLHQTTARCNHWGNTQRC